MSLPVHLRLDGRPVLVVGAGPVGRRRTEALIAAGARVRWVAPELDSHPHVQIIADRFQPAHCEGMTLVFACAPPPVNDAVAAAARAHGAWVCRADAEPGDFRLPAVIRRGPVTLSVASGTPAATRVLRDALDARTPAGWGHFASILARARARWAGAADRPARLRRLAGGPLAAVLDSSARPAPAEVERWIRAAEREA